jgi:hypothetical protein
LNTPQPNQRSNPTSPRAHARHNVTRSTVQFSNTTPTPRHGHAPQRNHPEDGAPHPHHRETHPHPHTPPGAARHPPAPAKPTRRGEGEGVRVFPQDPTACPPDNSVSMFHPETPPGGPAAPTTGTTSKGHHNPRHPTPPRPPAAPPPGARHHPAPVTGHGIAGEHEERGAPGSGTP